MDRERVGFSRRHVFRAAAGASVAAAAGVSASEDAQAYTPGGDETRARYRETDHVKAFYKTNGYETKTKK